MFLIVYIQDFIEKLNDDSLPIELRGAILVFLVCIISTMCFFNILFYFTVLMIADNKYIIELMEKWWLLKKVINVYKYSSKFFIIFEVCIFSYLNFTLLYNCFKIIRHLIDQ
jgi:hypothetical protein